MLAKVSVKPTNIMNELEQCPNSLLWLATNGRKSHDPDVRGRHDDGCGMAYIDLNGEMKSTRHGKADFWSTEYREFAEKSQSKLYIAHNRFASSGLNTLVNGAHPFLTQKFGEKLAFCHNGAVNSYMAEANSRHTSDSEILMEKLVEPLTELSTNAVAKSISKIATLTDFSSLCGFLLSKTELYIWRIFNETNTVDFDKLSRYFTLYISIRETNILIASEPIDNENWQLIPNYQMMTFTPGKDEISIMTVALRN